MKISDLIIELQTTMSDYGDVDVVLNCECEIDERIVAKAQGTNIEWFETWGNKEVVVEIHD
ncbi:MULTISPECIES: hypothetical protein [unclassified Clostridium]|uniref:hypothetical protein n=1 Tax=unclassified Clostridium TaxID=2614128 RepID=UPI0025C39C1A|nr:MULTISPECIES: hypothetical protein [unclassified Clostridium]